MPRLLALLTALLALSACVEPGAVAADPDAQDTIDEAGTLGRTLGTGVAF